MRVMWVVAAVAAGTGACGHIAVDGPDASDASAASDVSIADGCSMVRCGAQCVDTQHDPQHCGDCTTVCSTSDAGNAAVCSGGTCTVECNGGLLPCGNDCVDETKDPKHCGDCATVCAACNQGSCCPPQDNAVCLNVCADTTSDNANCGGCATACDAGLCLTSTCHATAYKVGNYMAFGSATSNGPGWLFGNRITLTKPAKLVDFGVISLKNGPNITMALYTDNSGQADALVAYTASTWLTASDQQIAANTPASLNATSYWIMAIFDAAASVGVDYSNTNAVVDSTYWSYATPLPSTLKPYVEGSTAGDQFNYYVIVE